MAMKYYAILLILSVISVACDDGSESDSMIAGETAAGEMAAGETTAGEMVAGEMAAGEMTGGD